MKSKNKEKKKTKIDNQEKKKSAEIQNKSTSFGATPVKWSKDENGQDKFEFDPTRGNKQKLFESVMGVGDLALGINILLESAGAIEPRMKDLSKDYIMQTINDLKPSDAIEARLAAQAAVAWLYAMKSMKLCGSADMLCHIEAMANLGIKLMRVHNETVESLARHRRGGEQRVIVQHQQVNISGEAKAVVGNFEGGGGGEIIKNRGDSPCPHET